MSFIFSLLRPLGVAISLLLALNAKAQLASQDYVATTAGDTLRGRLRLTGKALQTLKLYRPQEAPATFTPDQVNSYGVGHTALKVSKLVGSHGRARFLVPLVRGYASLYAGSNAEGLLRYYLQPADSAYVVEIVPSSALLTYARLLPGCPALEIGTAKFQQRYLYNRSGLTRLVTDYNKCRQQPTEVLRTPGLRASYGFKAGFNRSSFALAADSYGQQVYTTNHTGAVGFQAGVVMLLSTRSHLGLQLEGTYIHLTSNYGPAPPASYNSGIYLGTYAVQIRYSQVQIPVLLHYTIGHGGFAPYLNLGPSLGINFANNSIRSDYNTAGTASTDHPFAANINRFSIGGAAGAGVLLHKAGLPALLLEARYDYMLENTDGGLNHKSLRLEAGVLF